MLKKFLRKRYDIKVGLMPLPEDDRDLGFSFSKFFGGAYSPKHVRKDIDLPFPARTQKFNTCFVPETEVLMEDFSLKPIRDISVNDRVFTHKGNIKKVKRVMRKENNEKLVSLKVVGDYRTLKMTKEHPVLCFDGDKIDFVRADKITKNHYIAFPFNNISADKTIYSFEKDPEFLWVFGLYLAEGSLAPSQVCFSLHRKETYFFDRIKKAMEKYGASVTCSERESNGLSVKINSKKWRDIFLELGNEHCDKKEINKRLMFLSPELQMNIYNGLYDGDGTLTRYKSENIHITSKKLLEQIKIILLRNRYYSNLRKEKKRGNRKQCYLLERKLENGRYFVKENFCFVPINEVSLLKRHTHVYNLEVEDDETYQAYGIAVHNCGWHSSTKAKEVDEQVELDPRITVMFGREMGLISGDGFSNLRSNEEVLLKCGCAEKGKLQHIDNGSWGDYSNPAYLTKGIRENAAKHKTKSYSRIYTVDECYRAIDEGRTVKVGLNWRTSMNMGGGFSVPWIVDFIKGWLVGGHAVYLRGYDTKYKGYKVFKVRNSYGREYGLDGDFYIKEADLAKQIATYGAYTNLDADKDILGWLKTHQGLVVKTEKSPDVFLIQGDKKRKYDDIATLYAHGKLDSDIITADHEYLDRVPLGEHIDFWSGGNIKMAKAIIQQRKNLRPIFEKYFKELWD